MIKDAEKFVIPSGKITKLPNRSNPKLIIPKIDQIKSWRYSAFFPAFRKIAKLYRQGLRVSALFRASEIVNESDLGNEFILFCEQAFEKEIDAGVVLIGTKGPTQKLTIQIWSQNVIIGYIKYSNLKQAIKSISNEHQVMKDVPESIRPKALRIQELGNGIALALSAISGDQIEPKLSNTNKISQAIEPLVREKLVEIGNHPWVHKLKANQLDCDIDRWLNRLASKKWPIVIQHGDLAPWNIIRNESSLKLIDWEFGNSQGFQYMDEVFYILQTARLIYKWKPIQAYQYSIEHLKTKIPTEFCDSIVKLSVFDTYQNSIENGYNVSSPDQQWRNSILKL